MHKSEAVQRIEMKMLQARSSRNVQVQNASAASGDVELHLCRQFLKNFEISRVTGDRQGILDYPETNHMN